MNGALLIMLIQSLTCVSVLFLNNLLNIFKFFFFYLSVIFILLERFVCENFKFPWNLIFVLRLPIQTLWVVNCFQNLCKLLPILKFFVRVILLQLNSFLQLEFHVSNPKVSKNIWDCKNHLKSLELIQRVRCKCLVIRFRITSISHLDQCSKH